MHAFFKSTAFSSTDAVLAIVRIFTGLFMAYHGWEVFDAAKMAEYAKWDVFSPDSGAFLAYLGKGSELVGGVLLALGLFTRVGAVILLCTMAYITFFVGKGRFWYEDQHPFMFVLLAIVYLFAGGGAWSSDRKLFG